MKLTMVANHDQKYVEDMPSFGICLLLTSSNFLEHTSSLIQAGNAINKDRG
jgi:hypothetical protein